MRKTLASAIVLVLLLGNIVSAMDVWACPDPGNAFVAMDPSLIEYDYYAVGESFTVAVRIGDVEELTAFEFQIGWNTTWIEYVNHITNVPVESYPDGVLHSPTMRFKDEVDESGEMPFAEPGTMFWVAYGSMGAAPTFNGSGIACEITFRIKQYPFIPDPDIEFYIHFVMTGLANPYPCGGIIHTRQDCHVIFHASPPPYGPTARFTLSPETAKRRELVTFDGSDSLPGFNGAHEVPIVRYYWSFRDGNVTATSTPIVCHSFEKAGVYDVTLTVYAPGATPEKGSISHKVTVSSIAVGGYSTPIKNRSEKQLTFHLALIVILTTIFLTITRKQYRGK